MDMLEGLNKQQREAVETVEGPVLILAGPGSGKTRVITHRIAYLIRECGVSPYRIAAVTFTNKAAREMRERLFGRTENDTSAPLLAGYWNQQHMFTVTTFHAFCASVLRREGELVGLNNRFVIYDQEDQLTVLKRAMEEEEIDPRQFAPRSVLAAISAAKSKLLDPEAYEKARSSYLEGIVARAYRRYQAILHDNNAADFDDLLLNIHRLFRDHPEALERYQSRYVHLLVDEFQDTNVVQYTIARQLAGKHRNICVVGDPDQSIYSWRNADVRNIMSFQQDYPEARLVTLEENYRSTGTIVEAAHAVISASNGRVDKLLRTRNPAGTPVYASEAYNPEEEAQQVLREVERLVREKELTLGDCAVMYRVNAQSRALEEACLRYGVPYRLIGGLRFYQRKEVKDVIAYLRAIQNPYDEVGLLRVINVPTRGIGQRTIDHLAQWARSKGIPLYSALQMVSAQDRLQGEGPGINPRASQALARFLHLLNGLMEAAQTLPVGELIDAVLERTGYGEFLQKDVDRGREGWENVRELRSTSLEFQAAEPGEALSAFLEGVALVSDLDSLKEGQDAVTLITLHQAKGLEFPVVFIVGLEEGLLPHIRSFDDATQMEEERRLFYVGMTRAMERLYLMRAFRRGFRGNASPSDPSRFLADVPSHLLSPLTPTGRPVPLGQQTTSALSATRPQAVAAPAPLKAGERVRHARFGEGIVVNCEQSGQDHQVTVAFKGDQGVKRLLLSYAPLEKVDG